tara:strand:+ start:172 stop:522 length:351 start_codon:yes stop_codon:yes gene_type:complete
MEFGKGVLNALPADYSQSEMEDAMLTIITVWNAIVLDTWYNTNRNEKMVLDALCKAPKEDQLQVKRLIKRKKTKFSDDIRAVGEHWIREEQGEFIFGCEARLDIERISLVEDSLKH